MKLKRTSLRDVYVQNCSPSEPARLDRQIAARQRTKYGKNTTLSVQASLMIYRRAFQYIKTLTLWPDARHAVETDHFSARCSSRTSLSTPDKIVQERAACQGNQRMEEGAWVCPFVRTCRP